MDRKDVLYILLIIVILLLEWSNNKSVRLEHESFIDSLKVQNNELIMQIDSLSNVVVHQNELIEDLKTDIEINSFELIKLKKRRDEEIDIISKLSTDESIRILTEFLSGKDSLR